MPTWCNPPKDCRSSSGPIEEERRFSFNELFLDPGKVGLVKGWFQEPFQEAKNNCALSLIGPKSLDVADMDNDGDLDVVVGEHNLTNPSTAKFYIYENADGHGLRWKEHVVYTGDEHHDGAQVVDIDGDGDLDILSIGWSHNQVLLYENKAVQRTRPIDWPQR